MINIYVVEYLFFKFALYRIEVSDTGYLSNRISFTKLWIVRYIQRRLFPWMSVHTIKLPYECDVSVNDFHRNVHILTNTQTDDHSWISLKECWR